MFKFTKVYLLLALLFSSSVGFALPIHDAARFGDVEEARRLLAAGADVEAKDNSGWTALMLAAQNGHVGVVQALLAARADVNAVCHSGWTALMLAALYGHVGAVQALLNAGADLTITNNAGQTPMQVATPEVQDAIQQWQQQRVLALPITPASFSPSSLRGFPAGMLRARVLSPIPAICAFLMVLNRGSNGGHLPYLPWEIALPILAFLNVGDFHAATAPAILALPAPDDAADDDDDDVQHEPGCLGGACNCHSSSH